MSFHILVLELFIYIYICLFRASRFPSLLGGGNCEVQLVAFNTLELTNCGTSDRTTDVTIHKQVYIYVHIYMYTHTFNNRVRWWGGNPKADVDKINKPEMFYRNSDNVIPGRGNRTLRVSSTYAPSRRKFRPDRLRFELVSTQPAFGYYLF